MGRMSDLDIERQEEKDLLGEQDLHDYDMCQVIAEDKQSSSVLSLDVKQIVIDEHNRMMANAKQMDKQMEEEDAKKT
jgi:hypothetical protein|tara:strand:- start:3406 stop:3636 length:231 start_codon:yes stop_codon:yes gene_type:complete